MAERRLDIGGTSMETGYRVQGTGRSNYNYELRIIHYECMNAGDKLLAFVI
jgi:hypothetical protein